MRIRGGFTIVELLIVIGILVIICGIVVSAFTKFNRVESVNKDTETVLETLRLARNQTLAAKNDTQYGVRFASSSVILFSGASYVPGAASNQTYFLHAGDTVLSLQFVGATSSILFQRLTGAAASYGTATISSKTTSSSDSVIISSTGRIAGPTL